MEQGAYAECQSGSDNENGDSEQVEEQTTPKIRAKG
jgi:hypothetical protein